MHEYLVPAGLGEAEYVEKKSRFIGRVFPCESEEEAIAHIRAVAEANREARHNVYAYIIRDNHSMRYSDNGEPQGTAGMPTLEVLRREGVENALCVTTRYFGGVLLGAGGLTRAYAHIAKLALDAAGIAQMRAWTELELVVPYHLQEQVRRALEDRGGLVENVDYAAEVTFSALIPSEAQERLSETLLELTAGQLRPTVRGVKFKGVRIR